MWQSKTQNNLEYGTVIMKIYGGHALQSRIRELSTESIVLV